MPELRPFQEEDAAFFTVAPRSMILYEMRLGKTPTDITTIVRKGRRVNIVICPNNALYVWLEHITEWDPREKSVRICHGSATDRILAWSKPRTTAVTWYITTYGSLLRDIKDIQKYVPVDNVTLDEAKRIRNHKSKAFEAVKKLTHSPSITVQMLEGTPTNKGPKDFWTMFNIIDRKRFGSYHAFTEHFYETVDGLFGGKELVQPRNLDEFHRLLQQYSRVRYRADVRPEMPTVQRELIPIDMDAEQSKLYRALDLSSFAFSDFENLIVAPTSLERSIRLRQLLICPKLLDVNYSLGSAWDAFTETLKDAETVDERNVVLFCPFTAPFPYWEADLRARGFKDVFLLSGKVHPARQKEILTEASRTRGIVICSIRYAEAFSLAPATASYFIGQEWNPNTNRQAEDRLVPQQGTNPITAFYYAYNNTIEFDVVRHLDAQQRIIDKTMGRKT